MPHCQTIIEAGIIITQDDARRVLYNAALAIHQGVIVDIGSARELRSRWAADRIMDLNHALVMPGLVNAHTHAAMTFLRGLADDMPLMAWLNEKIFPVEARLTKEIVRLGSLLGYAEMLATGTTACIDMYIFEEGVFEAATQAGIRCMGGEAVFMFPSAACADYHAALERTRSLHQLYAANPRIKIAVNPHSVYTTNPEILGECRNLALEHGLPLHIHLSETREETERCLATYGRRPVAHLAANGLFDCRVIAAHLVDILPEEAAFLAQNNVHGVHNPSSNMKLASGCAPVPQMLAAGLPLALGSDGPASNNQINMFAEMGRAALLHKLFGKDPAALPAQMVLDMATLGGAAAFGDSALGRLSPGARADCIALDLRRPNMQPLHEPVSQAVYAASGHECLMTMVDGEVLYENGRFTRFAYEDILEQAKTLRDFARGKIHG